MVAREPMPKLHGAKVLSGLGRAGAFTRNAMLPRSPWQQTRECREGHCLYKITDCKSEYQSLMFLGEQDGMMGIQNFLCIAFLELH